MASGQALFWLWLPSPLLCSVGCHRRRSLQGWRVFLLATLSSTFSTISSGWPTQTRFQIGTWVVLLLLVSLGPACAMMLKFVVSCERFGWLRLTDCKVSSLFYSDSSCSFLAKHSNPYYFSNHCRGHFTRVVLIRQQVTKTDGHFIVAGHNRWYFLLKYGASLPDGVSCQPTFRVHLFLYVGTDPIADQGQGSTVYKFPNYSCKFV